MKPLVLIADHNPIVRKTVRKFIAGLDIDVRQALSGPELLHMARTLPPDVIILENELPGPSGRNVLKSIKSEDGLRHIPIILIGWKGDKPDSHAESAAESAEKDEEKAFKIVGKPFTEAELLDALHAALKYVGINKIQESAKGKQTPEAGEADELSARHEAEIGYDKSLIDDERDKKIGRISEIDFEKFQDFLMKKVGLFFDVKRKDDLGKALRNRMKALDIGSYAEYFQFLGHSFHEEKELRNLVLYLTIGETTYFRSPDQFKAMREYILPRVLPDRRKAGPPTLRIWSAGCSTGEEPYSIAITLREILPDIDGWNIEIYATDINQKFLRFAHEGLYHPRKTRFVNEHILDKYFVMEGEHYRVAQKVRDMVKFDFHNLSVDSYDRFGAADIVFCRNVLIYFRRDRIKEVIDKFHGILKDDGYLVLGYSETLFQISGDFKSIHFGEAFFYSKATEAEKSHQRQFEDKGKTPPPYSGKPAFNILPAGKDEAPPRLENLHASPFAGFESETYKAAGGKSSAFAPVAEAVTAAVAEAVAEPPDHEPRSIEGSKEVGKIWEEGLNHYFYERFDEAEEVFKQLAEKYPDDARSQLGIGFIYANKGKDAAAIEKIEQALEMDNLIPSAYYLRALLKEKNGEVEAAMADYRNVILLDPDFAMAHFNLGILYMKQQRVKDSKREFRNTLRILRGYGEGLGIKFSGGLHREALMQLCEELSE